MKILLTKHKPRTLLRGFSLIEALVTIALLGVLAAIVVSSYTDASAQSHAVIARQQAAAIKSALDSYVNAELSSVPALGAESGRAATRTTVAQLRTRYNGLSAAGKWAVIQQYLAEESLRQDDNQGGLELDGDNITSTSLEADGQVISLPEWNTGLGEYPQISLDEAG